MHILHVTPYYAPAYAFGGVVSAVEGMARVLVSRDHTVTVLTTDALTPTERITHTQLENLDGVYVVRVRNTIPALRARANLSTPLALPDTANFLVRQADVVHLHEFRTLEAWIVARIAARQRVPLVLSPHGTLPHGTGRTILKRAWDRLISPSVARRINAVIGLTDTEIAQARALWHTFNTTSAFYTIPNGIHPADFANLPDPHDFRQRWALGSGAVVLFMGRLHPRKGVIPLAHAFQQITDPDARLLIVGPDEGSGEQLQALAQRNPRIVPTGFLTGADRLAAFAAADLFVLPAVGEGLPMSALEAMAAGLPLILSPECYLPQVESANAGRIVPVDVAALHITLRDLLANPALRQQMSANALRLIHERFTWAAVAAQLETVYHSGHDLV